MFKNLIIYTVGAPAMLDALTINESLAKAPFVACGPTQQLSAGWIPPRGAEHGAMLEAIGGQWIAKLKIETKAVPAQVLARRVDDAAKAIEDQTGRKPGKKQRKDLKEEALLTLLPAAFPKQSTATVWIDPKAKRIAIDCASASRAEGVATMLVKCIDGLSLRLLSTNLNPATAMANWLAAGEGPAEFSIDRVCELKAVDETKATVRYSKHPLDTEEVRAHVAQGGKLPTRLGITHSGRISFMLTASLALRSITLDDTLFESRKAGLEDSFDADMAIATGTLGPAIDALIEALDGELHPPVDGPGDTAPAAQGDSAADPLLDKAREIVVAQRRASISLVQRHLQIGYNRAARLLESLELAGVVSPMNTSGMREVRA